MILNHILHVTVKYVFGFFNNLNNFIMQIQGLVHRKRIQSIRVWSTVIIMTAYFFNTCSMYRRLSLLSILSYFIANNNLFVTLLLLSPFT